MTTAQTFIHAVTLSLNGRRDDLNTLIAEQDPHNARCLAGTAVALYADALRLMFDGDVVEAGRQLQVLARTIAWEEV